MKMGIPAIALLILAACSKQNGEVKPDGMELYALHCAGCHDPGPGHPGTMLLQELDRPVASLIGRTDLDGDYVHSSQDCKGSAEAAGPADWRMSLARWRRSGPAAIAPVARA